MRFQDIPQMVRIPAVGVDIPLRQLEQNLALLGVNLTPPFQRDLVWTEAQQIAFVEYLLRGGEDGRIILINDSRNLGRRDGGNHVLVDGQQRLNAVRRFLAGEIRASGLLIHEWEDEIPWPVQLRFVTTRIKNDSAIYDMYIDRNVQGTPHTEAEIEKARRLRDEALAREAAEEVGRA